MATTTIPWGDGSGDNIYLTYSFASGDQTVEVSSDANTGSARSQTVTFTSGVGNITQQLTVNQDAGYVVQTFTANPSSYSGSSLTNATDAYNDETNTNGARARVTTTAGGTTSDYFIFNTSSIPANAVILSVSCKAKSYISSTTNISPRSICMYSGTTAKGSAQTLTGSAKVFTFSGVAWTRSELSSARVRVWATRTSGTTTSFIFFYGATLTVKYYVPQE